MELTEIKMSWLIRLIGIILFIFILTRIDLSSILSSVTKVNPWYLTAAVALNIPTVFLKSWRWQSLLKMQGITYSLRQAFLAYWGGIYLGMMTPGRLGELGRIFYLTDDKNLSFGSTFSNVLVDRLLDVYLLLIVGGYGLVAFSLLPERIMLFVIILILLLAFPFLLLNRRTGKWLAGLAYKTMFFRRFNEKFQISADQFYYGVQRLASLRLILPLLINLAAWAVHFTQYYLLVLSSNLPLSFLHITIYMAVVILVTLIPISIAGIGTRDATLITFFSLRSISAESALSYSLLVLFTSYVCGGVMAAISWQVKPIRASKRK